MSSCTYLLAAKGAARVPKVPFKTNTYPPPVDTTPSEPIPPFEVSKQEHANWFNYRFWLPLKFGFAWLVFGTEKNHWILQRYKFFV